MDRVNVLAQEVRKSRKTVRELIAASASQDMEIDRLRAQIIALNERLGINNNQNVQNGRTN